MREEAKPHGSGRRAARAVAFLTATAVAATVLAGPSVADSAAAGVRIVAPRDGAVVTGSTLVVRVRASGSSFRAWVDEGNIRARFGKPRRGVRTARLRRGRDFRLGDGRLLVAVGKPGTRRRRTDSIGFTALRRDNRLLRVRRRPARSGRAPLHLSARSKKPVETARVWLNGRRVDRRLNRHPDGRGLGGRLGADDWLRFGRNRVVTRVVHPDGTFARKARTFRVSRRAPLVGAGRSRAAFVKRRILLDGSATKPARRGDRLSYRWRIVEAPRGARFKVIGRRSARARLVAQTPGTYRARLTVRTVRRGARRAAASQVPLQPAPLQLAPATDEVVLALGENAGEMGLPVQTITDTGGIQIGSQPYKLSGDWIHMLVLNPASGSTMSGGWGDGDQSYNPGAADDLLTDIGKTGPGQLVLLTGQGIAVPTAAIDRKNLEAAFEKIGGTLASSGPTENGGLDLASGQWSVIGQKGLEPGEAWQNFAVSQAGVSGLLGGDPGRPGSLNGWFQRVTSNAYQFVSPEFVALDTKADGSSATQNIVSVGEQRYPSAPIPHGALGAQLLLLDPSSGLRQVAGETFVLNNADGSTNEGSPSGNGVQGLAQQLQRWRQPVPGHEHQPPVLILQTFGAAKPGTAPLGSRFWVNDALPSFAHSLDWYNNPYPTQRQQLLSMWNPGYPTVAGQVAQLAGMEYHDVVANFGFGGRGMGGLTVVTGTQLWNPSSSFAQGQSDPVPSPGRAVGTLTRNRQSQWTLSAPASTSGWTNPSPGNNAPEKNALDTTALWEIAFSPTTQWEATGGSLDQANACIAGQMWGTDVTDVRDAYVSKSSDFKKDGGTLLDQLRNDVTFPVQAGDPVPPACQSGFSADDFGTVKKQLLIEFGYVNKVWTGIENWQDLFGDATSSSYIDIQSKANDIVSDVLSAQASLPKKQAGLDAFGISADGLLVVSALADLAIMSGQWEALAFAPVALGGISAGIALAGDLTDSDDADATPPDPTGIIRDRASHVGYDLYKRYSDISSTLDHLGDVMVSDWGKLKVAGPRFNDQWAFGTAEYNAARKSYTVAAKQSLYEALMPIAYEQWVVSPRWTNDNHQGVPVPASKYRCRWVTNDPATSPGAWKFDGWANPFRRTPSGAVLTLTYRAATTAHPAQPRTSTVVGRGLKSAIARMNLQDYEGQLNVRHTGREVPSWVNNLFQPVTYGDSVSDPKYLGMSKEEFFGQPGWTMRKMQCGHNS